MWQKMQNYLPEFIQNSAQTDDQIKDQGIILRNISPYPSNTTSLLRTPGKVGRSHSQSVQSVPGYHACASMTRLYSSKVALRIFLVADFVDNPWHLQRNTYSKWRSNNLKSHRKFWDLESHCSIQYPTLKRWWACMYVNDKPNHIQSLSITIDHGIIYINTTHDTNQRPPIKSILD